MVNNAHIFSRIKTSNYICSSSMVQSAILNSKIKGLFVCIPIDTE